MRAHCLKNVPLIAAVKRDHRNGTKRCNNKSCREIITSDNHRTNEQEYLLADDSWNTVWLNCQHCQTSK